MKKPPTMDDALAQGLVQSPGILTFSNGTDWDSWSWRNCHECAHYKPEAEFGDLCAFECAAVLHSVTPELARLFGWTQDPRYQRLGEHRQGWQRPATCPFRQDRSDEGDSAPRTVNDPAQLVLLADPTEDAAHITTAPIPALVGQERAP